MIETIKNSKEIGGYFGLEIADFNCKNKFDAVALNDARNCLRYVIRAYGIKEIYLPFYTCPVVWQSVQKENCRIKFYHIDENFYPAQDFPENANILYTNYFGVCAKNVKKLSEKYQNLIVDNAQAFYMPKFGIASFNSIRKFFGVSDGAFLFCDKRLDEQFEKDVSYKRFSHLLKRIDVGAQAGYEDFCLNDDSLKNEDIKFMSNLTAAILNTIDMETVRQKRIDNFNVLHSKLAASNQLTLNLDNMDVPMVYPYLIKDDYLKKILIKNKIYVATYWNPLPEDYQEGFFQKYLIPLPIDQRYNSSDLMHVLDIINDIGNIKYEL